VLDGLAKSQDLPRACTLNGQCEEVCPVAIPLPTLLRGWRDRSWREGLEPVSVRGPLSLWRFMVLRPALYRLATNLAVPAMRLFAQGGWIVRMPLAGGWTRHRDLPAPAARTFMAQVKNRRPAR
jgi:L-lactate dehydrogenase complex protein LldF